jgi:hypothetical protein
MTTMKREVGKPSKVAAAPSPGQLPLKGAPIPSAAAAVPVSPAAKSAIEADAEAFQAALAEGKLPQAIFQDRILNKVALVPISRGDDASLTMAVGASALQPANPIEAMLGVQLVAANDAAMEMYRRAWEGHISDEVRLRYLAHADKAARTLATLVTTLDQHRAHRQARAPANRTTVHAEQAVVADQIVMGGGSAPPGGSVR